MHVYMKVFSLKQQQGYCVGWWHTFKIEIDALRRKVTFTSRCNMP